MFKFKNVFLVLNTNTLSKVGIRWVCNEKKKLKKRNKAFVKDNRRSTGCGKTESETGQSDMNGRQAFSTKTSLASPGTAPRTYRGYARSDLKIAPS